MAFEGLDKSPEQISRMFNRIAPTYDRLNDWMTLGLHRTWKRKACEALQLKPGDSVLDVCTGTGDLAATLAQQVGPIGQVTALDFSSEMLAIAQNRFLENAMHAPIQWTQGDALALPFENETFHGAVISFGLRNVANVQQALSEMARVVKPGGWVVNLDTASDCANPLFWLYFSKIMPLLGRFLARDEQAYGYLCQSTQQFETPITLISYFQNVGLCQNRLFRFGLGSVAMQVGQKRYP